MIRHFFASELYRGSYRLIERARAIASIAGRPKERKSRKA